VIEPRGYEHENGKESEEFHVIERESEMHCKPSGEECREWDSESELLN
jgi:hypothetical protein